MTITVYIVVKPQDFTTANVEVFADKKDAEATAREWKFGNSNDKYVTIRKAFINV